MSTWICRWPWHKDEFKASNRMDETNTINSLVSTTDDIKSRMDTNHLKMNGAKTEFITFAAGKQLPKCEITEITVDNCVIQRASVIHYLGAWLDQHLSLKTDYQQVCHSYVQHSTYKAYTKHSNTICMPNTHTRISNSTPQLCQCSVFQITRYRCEKNCKEYKT